jgi:ABC-type lipoprotein release transport system permease subunit
MTASGDSRPADAVPVRSIWGLTSRLLRHWWPHLVALAAACGIVATTIAGSLGVGDSLQRGLRRLALARLGGIQAAVLSDGFFRAGLAGETAARLKSPANTVGEVADRLVPAVVPAVVLEVSLQIAAAGDRAGTTAQATLLACDAVPSLGFPMATETPLADTVALNRPLAAALGVRPGDPVVLRITKVGEVPSDSPLGRRTAETWSRRLRVAEVLPDGGVGEFSLRPAQVTGGLAVTSLSTVQAILRRADPPANTLLAVTDPAVGPAVSDLPTARDGVDRLRGALKPAAEDIGLVFETPAGSGAWRLSSRRLLLPAEADRVAAEVLGPLGGRPTLVFLANTLTPLVEGRPGPAMIPYSTVVGIDATHHPVGDLVDDRGNLLAMPGADEIVIDRWMADDFAAQGVPVVVGDSIEVRYFMPETLHCRVVEVSGTIRFSGMSAMQGAAVARDLVPEVEGITDEASVADWNPPFPFDRSRIRTTPPHDEDDRYWKQYGPTPKAFVSLAVARRLAGSRFGITTAWHVPVDARQSPDTIRAAIASGIRVEAMGMQIVPLRAQAEAAARGSTPFGSLFIALSSFVVISGLLLEWLLFSLLVAAKRRDVGMLAAIGWPAARVASLLSCVGGVAALSGVLLGTLLGPLWARVLLQWLAGAWETGVAVGSSSAFAGGSRGGGASGLNGIGGFGDFARATLADSLLPAALSAAVSLAAVAVAAWRTARMEPIRLLKGATGGPVEGRSERRRAIDGLAILGPTLALGLAWWARFADPQAAVGLFFAAGFAALAGLLAVVRLLLGGASPAKRRPLRTLSGLAWRGLTHGRSRAFSVAAIVACAEFLIVAVSSFALQPPPRPHDRAAPTGGWTFLAAFGSSTGIDPADAVARESLGLSDVDRATLADCTIARIRSSSGDDASCVNLYAPSQPTVLGVGDAFIDRGGFRFLEHAPLTGGTVAAEGSKPINPWRLLNREETTEASPAGSLSPLPAPENPPPTVVPVIVDQATAQWALKLGGIASRFTLPVDQGVAEFEIVGLLEPGILQGYLLVSERNFERLFPRRSGYSLALIDAGGQSDAGGVPDNVVAGRVARAVAAAWADAGVTVTPTLDRLRSLQAVQNTFLAGFQALGTLGLVLGAAGVAAVQFQSVLERQGLLGLMAAVGFTRQRLRLLVVLETLLMVVLGLAVGTLAGCLALVPAFSAGRAGVPVGWIGFTWGLTLVAAVAAGLVAAQRVLRHEPGKALATAD